MNREGVEAARRAAERLAEAGVEPSAGHKGDRHDSPLAETINGRPLEPGGFTRRPASGAGYNRNWLAASNSDSPAASTAMPISLPSTGCAVASRLTDSETPAAASQTT
jgi:hypothetical protein